MRLPALLSLVCLAYGSLCPPFKFDQGRVSPDVVTELSPADISIVMAMGDSITAAFSANNRIEEYRGASFPIGGDLAYDGLIPKLSPSGEPIYSVPNLLRTYNPKLMGFSEGIHSLETTGKPRYPTDHLNAAQSTARVQDMMGQVEYLYGELTSGKYGNSDLVLNQLWKHLTIFVGANNLCGACDTKDKTNTPEMYEKELNLVLNHIYERIPKTVVSFISIPHFSRLRNLEPNPGWCKTLHIFYGECSCVLQGSDEDLRLVDTATDQFNQVLRNIHLNWKQRVYETISQKQQPQFAVVLHPFNEDITIPDEKYLSTLDCFHPSAIAHENFAIATWNSLFLPFAQKPINWNFNTSVFCPGPNDFIRLD